MNEKIRRRLASIIVIIMLGVTFFGLVRFFGGPLYDCVMGDCGKQALPLGAAYAHQFLGWQTSVLVVWSVGLFSLWLLRDKRNKK